MKLLTVLGLGAAGYAGYQLLKPQAPVIPSPAPGPVQEATFVPPPPERTAVVRGSRILLAQSMQREPKKPQFTVKLPRPGGFLTVVCWATVRNGIWHEYIAGKGAWAATEDKHTGLNACGFARWRGSARRGVQLPIQVAWAAVPGCPPDASHSPLQNRLGWLQSDARISIADDFQLTLWNEGDRYRGNAYDLRMEWAWTPPA